MEALLRILKSPSKTPEISTADAEAEAASVKGEATEAAGGPGG